MKKAQLKELLTQYGPIEYIWFDHAQTDGGLNHAETVKWCKQFQPGCFIGFNHGPPAGDIRLGELGHPSPLADETGYVTLPNVNVAEEMVNMLSASRSYQSNLEVMNTAKSLLLKTLTLGN